METIENTATINNVDQAVTSAAAVDCPRRCVNKSERFTPGDVLAMFGADLLDEQRCRIWVLTKIHPKGAHCPRCGNNIGPAKFILTLPSFWKGGRVRCDQCGKYFTALTGTFLSGCHLKFREIILLALLLALDVPDKQIAAIIKMSAENVRLWRLKFNGQKK
jgi:transposase-like protein